MAERHLLRATCFVAALLWGGVASGADSNWQIGKSSGDVWIVTPGTQAASLSHQTEIKAGDVVRTGSSGRVLLRRGEESILVAPNSEISIPQKPTDGLSTTIIQKAGSILLNVERRSDKHFDVETPYLAAVVKGTQFRVDVDGKGARVNVVRGQVEVADFKSGQIAQVMPGQAARISINGANGISLTGAGQHLPIVSGQPRAPTVERLSVPRHGLGAPPQSGQQQIRALRPMAAPAAIRQAGPAGPSRIVGEHQSRTRISAPLGEVKLDVGRATHHLVRSVETQAAGRRGGSDNSTTRDSASNSAAPAAAPTAAAAAAPAAATASTGVGGGPANRGRVAPVSAGPPDDTPNGNAPGRPPGPRNIAGGRNGPGNGGPGNGGPGNGGPGNGGPGNGGPGNGGPGNGGPGNGGPGNGGPGNGGPGNGGPGNGGPGNGGPGNGGPGNGGPGNGGPGGPGNGNGPGNGKGPGHGGGPGGGPGGPGGPGPR